MLKHVLFDNDGTVVDSEIIAVRTTLSLLAPYGFQMSEQEYSRRFPGLLERDIVAIIGQEFGIRVGDDYFDRLRAAHVESFDRELRAISGMPAIFRNLKTPKSMVSNGSVRHVERCLRRVRLRSALDGHIFSAEHVERPKPHPDVYYLALEKLLLQPSDILVVEDSPTGVQAAKQAGLRVVGFLGAAHIHDGHDAQLLDCGADFIAEDAKSLGKLLEKFGAL
ncbi:MAG: HAD family phosphatase [Haliscomenobacteraceae bacterium CHB4]|nr:6-phosphogluconate phosphatase [Saprospiraceae bacterium]MCE7922345.1 HAD family phosphatase [Haliscomenobacteraceae bacterium CHB4]